MRTLSYLLLMGLVLNAAGVEPEKGPENPFTNRWEPAPVGGSFRMDDYIIWGGSVIRHDDGRYYMFASRWPQSLTMRAWVTSSEVVLASSDNPGGPYTFEQVVLPRRGEGYWDGLATHNPTIHRHDGQYLLFYVGVAPVVPAPTDSAPSRDEYNEAWNSKRIGVATAPTPQGPWTRMDRPILEPRPGEWDAAITSNPGVVVHEDGSVLLLYKSCPLLYPERRAGSRLYLGLARAPSIEGPYERLNPEQALQIGGKEATWEDGYIWFADGYYHMVAKAMDNNVIRRSQGLYAWSRDGEQWHFAEDPLAYEVEVTWSDGRQQQLRNRERAQVLLEDGRPIMVFFATHVPDEGIFNTGIGVAQDETE